MEEGASPPPDAHQPGRLEAMEVGQMIGRKGAWAGSGESIVVRTVTTRGPVHACKGAALCMPYNSSTHAMEARHLPLHVMKHACKLRNTQAYVGSLVQLTFLHKLE